MTLAEDIARATIAFEAGATEGTARLRFAGDEVFFEGHFPERPVLPAVVQVAAAVDFASRVAGERLRLCEVTRAKFTNPTGPGRELLMHITLEPAHEGKHRVKAVIKDGDLEVAELNLRVTA